MVQLRDYQKACVEAVLTAWGEAPYYQGGETFRSVLANLATSAGKTVIAGAVIDIVRHNGRCLFLADTDELCGQPRRTFANFFEMPVALEKAGSRASLDARFVVVGSAQTFQRERRRKRFAPDHFQYIFVDEAHRGSDRNKVITDYFSSAKVMGMTATAFRAKLKDLSEFYDHVAFEMGMLDLINLGYIAPLKVLTLPVNVDISGVHQMAGDYNAEELDTTIAPYYEEICRLIKEHASDRQIICYLPLIKSSQEFVTIALAMEIDARHVDGHSENREEILRQFARGDFQLLSNSQLLTTGWDCPKCDCLLNLAPTRSAGLFRQKVGRIGRLLPGVIDGIDDPEARKAAIAASAKPNALILDLLWQFAKYGVQGPADLVAENADQKEALEKKLRENKTAEDLQEVSAEVQKARETALANALEALKKRAGEAINLVASLLHLKKVVNYEPVSKWETMPVSPGQRMWLLKNGVDPDSAKDRGHASAFMETIIDRKRKGLASHRVVQILEKTGVQDANKKTALDAYEILGSEYPMGMGKHAGRPLRAVPMGYWQWCLEQPWYKGAFPVEWRYASKVLGRPEEKSEPALFASPDAEDDEIPF